MTFRLPQNLSTGLGPEIGESALDAALLAEKAFSLGLAGRRVETAMATLRGLARTDPARDAAVVAAAAAVHAYFIQRELCGFRNNDAPVHDYAISGEVLARVGARSPPA